MDVGLGLRALQQDSGHDIESCVRPFVSAGRRYDDGHMEAQSVDLGACLDIRVPELRDLSQYFRHGRRHLRCHAGTDHRDGRHVHMRSLDGAHG